MPLTEAEELELLELEDEEARAQASSSKPAGKNREQLLAEHQTNVSAMAAPDARAKRYNDSAANVAIDFAKGLGNRAVDAAKGTVDLGRRAFNTVATPQQALQFQKPEDVISPGDIGNMAVGAVTAPFKALGTILPNDNPAPPEEQGAAVFDLASGVLGARGLVKGIKGMRAAKANAPETIAMHRNSALDKISKSQGFAPGTEADYYPNLQDAMTEISKEVKSMPVKGGEMYAFRRDANTAMDKFGSKFNEPVRKVLGQITAEKEALQIADKLSEIADSMELSDSVGKSSFKQYKALSEDIRSKAPGATAQMLDDIRQQMNKELKKSGYDLKDPSAQAMAYNSNKTLALKADLRDMTLGQIDGLVDANFNMGAPFSKIMQRYKNLINTANRATKEAQLFYESERLRKASNFSLFDEASKHTYPSSKGVAISAVRSTAKRILPDRNAPNVLMRQAYDHMLKGKMGEVGDPLGLTDPVMSFRKGVPGSEQFQAIRNPIPLGPSSLDVDPSGITSVTQTRNLPQFTPGGPASYNTGPTPPRPPNREVLPGLRGEEFSPGEHAIEGAKGFEFEKYDFGSQNYKSHARDFMPNTKYEIDWSTGTLRRKLTPPKAGDTLPLVTEY